MCASVQNIETPPAPPVTLADAEYQGWSGFILKACDQTVPALVFDPSPDVDLPPDPCVIAITHGHPEHVSGSVAHLRRTSRSPVVVMASTSVCRYLARRSKVDGDRFIPVDVGSERDESGWRIRVFGWRHMTLLPPGVRTAARHLIRLLSHPFRLACVGMQALGGPRHAPMLGFHVTLDDPTASHRLVYFGEGLHRMTTPEELTAAFGDHPVDTLVAGIEPEDAELVPDTLHSRPIKRVVLFEPHRVWREQFGMPQVDLAGVAARLESIGYAVDTPSPGSSLALAPIDRT